MVSSVCCTIGLSYRLTVVIPSFSREAVLVDIVNALQTQMEAAHRQEGDPCELLLIDQTQRHEPATESRLSELRQADRLRWLRLPTPHLIGAMNRGLLEARGELVLYLDDDILSLRRERALALRQLAYDPAELRRLGSAAHARQASQFSWRVCGEALRARIGQSLTAGSLEP